MYQTNIFSIILLILLFFHCIEKKKHFTNSGRIFLLLLINTICVLLFEILSWMFNGLDLMSYRVHNIIFNFVFFSFNIIVPINWLLYFDYKIYNSISHLRKRLFYIPFFIISLTAQISNIFYPWIYEINKNNEYMRLNGMTLFTVYIFIIIYFSVTFFRKSSKRNFSNRINKALLYYTILPLVGAVYQTLTPGSLVVWNFVSIALIGTFIALELYNNSRDFLTGLLNRRYIYEIIEFKIYSLKKSGKGFSLIMIDLDKFKIINDTLGHITGDDALIVFSNILQNICKSTDYIARFAGDEFLILLNNGSDIAVSSLINRLNEKLNNFNSKGLKEYHLSCSAAGKTFGKGDKLSVHNIVKSVDSLMYQVKKAKQ